MGVFKNDIGRPSNKKRLLRKLFIALVIIIFILLLFIYLYINRFPYAGHKYQDDGWNVIHFEKNGEYSMIAPDAGNDLSDCEHERYFYNKRKSKISLYCGLKKVNELKIIHISDNDIVYKNFNSKDKYSGAVHMKKDSSYYSDINSSYEKRMKKVGNNIIEKLSGKVFYFENNYYQDKKLNITVYFKDKETILYNLNGNTYKVYPNFSDYSGEMIDINIAFCGSLNIIYDIKKDKILYTNGEEKKLEDVNIDIENIKDSEDYYDVCDNIFRKVIKGLR